MSSALVTESLLMSSAEMIGTVIGTALGIMQVVREIYHHPVKFFNGSRSHWDASNANIQGTLNATHLHQRCDHSCDELYLIRFLDLRGNRIEAIDPGAFRMLPSLRQLSLETNAITSITADAFIGLSNLKELNLGGNAIERIDQGTFKWTPALTILQLTGNSISWIAPSAFFDLSHLSTLILAHNQLRSLSPLIFAGLTSLSTLALQGNRISSLHSDTFSHLPSLSRLTLCNNPFQSIAPDSLTWLPELQTLFIDIDPIWHQVDVDSKVQILDSITFNWDPMKSRTSEIERFLDLLVAKTGARSEWIPAGLVYRIEVAGTAAIDAGAVTRTLCGHVTHHLLHDAAFQQPNFVYRSLRASNDIEIFLPSPQVWSEVQRKCTASEQDALGMCSVARDKMRRIAAFITVILNTIGPSASLSFGAPINIVFFRRLIDPSAVISAEDAARTGICLEMTRMADRHALQSMEEFRAFVYSHLDPNADDYDSDMPHPRLPNSPPSATVAEYCHALVDMLLDPARSTLFSWLRDAIRIPPRLQTSPEALHAAVIGSPVRDADALTPRLRFTAASLSCREWLWSWIASVPTVDVLQVRFTRAVTQLSPDQVEQFVLYATGSKYLPSGMDIVVRFIDASLAGMHVHSCFGHVDMSRSWSETVMLHAIVSSLDDDPSFTEQ